MPTKLKDTLEKVRKLDNRSNSDLLIEFYEYMRAVRTSERYQSDVLKVLVKFSEFINDNLMNVQKKEQVIAFLNTKIKNKVEDPEEKWITTWNDYLWRIKYFFRWLYNIKKKENIDNFVLLEPSNWTTPIFVEIKKIKTKRLSPYLESELWEKDEIISIIKYEPYLRIDSKALYSKIGWERAILSIALSNSLILAKSKQDQLTYKLIVVNILSVDLNSFLFNRYLILDSQLTN